VKTIAIARQFQVNILQVVLPSSANAKLNELSIALVGRHGLQDSVTTWYGSKLKFKYNRWGELRAGGSERADSLSKPLVLLHPICSPGFNREVWKPAPYRLRWRREECHYNAIVPSFAILPLVESLRAGIFFKVSSFSANREL